MIIYRDITSESKDELLSDIFEIKDVGNGLWEVDCKMINKGGNESFVLAGANASAEEEAEGDAEAEVVRVLDIQDQFRLNHMESKPSKKAYMGEMKIYMKKVVAALKKNGATDEKVKEFQTGAQAGIKKLLANWDNYDVYTGESMEEGTMYVLVDFREDGITPYATYWGMGLEQYKV